MSDEVRQMYVHDDEDGWSCPAVHPATDDEVRAAVVPLLDLEAAAKALRPYLAEDMPGWRIGWQDAVAKRAVYAALGLGEDE